MVGLYLYFEGSKTLMNAWNYLVFMTSSTVILTSNSTLRLKVIFVLIYFFLQMLMTALSQRGKGVRRAERGQEP